MTEQEELSLRAVKAFPELFKDAWKHDIDCEVVETKCCDKCSKCGKHAEPVEYIDKDGNTINEDIYWERSAIFKDTPCTVPDPIDINWDSAMKLVRECDGDKVRDELVKIWAGRESIPVSIIKMWQAFSVWLITRATLADYILAACEAKENLMRIGIDARGVKALTQKGDKPEENQQDT